MLKKPRHCFFEKNSFDKLQVRLIMIFNSVPEGLVSITKQKKKVIVFRKKEIEFFIFWM